MRKHTNQWIKEVKKIVLTWSVTECLLEVCVEVDSCSTSWERFPSHLYSSVKKYCCICRGYYCTVQFVPSAGANTVLFSSKVPSHLQGLMAPRVNSAGSTHTHAAVGKSLRCVLTMQRVSTLHMVNKHITLQYICLLFTTKYFTKEQDSRTSRHSNGARWRDLNADDGDGDGDGRQAAFLV